MVTITNVATRMLQETKYTAGQIPLENLEYLIDNAVDYVNLMAGTSIADLTGATEAMQYVGSENETVAVKACVNLLMRAYLDKGPSVAVSGMNVVPVISDPHYKVETMILKTALNLLRGRSFERT